ncbi:SPC97/SPC98 domain-containing protein [Ceratobasidium sp. AG-Ba]|nr:SPC97/SPC98 domain-containing protein [Ceratobasidium sp. AG-Ba]
MLFTFRDPPASALLRTLLAAASAPYAQILRTWTHHGTLRDPHGEFFVRARVGAGELDSRGKTKEDYTDEYWERRYTTASRRISCPSPLDRSNYVVQPICTLAAPPPSALVPRPRVPGGRLPGGACVPPPLETWKHKVLLAGKYLNVVREWGGDAAGERKRRNKRRKNVTGAEKEPNVASRMSNRTEGSGKGKEEVEVDDGAMDSPSFYRPDEDQLVPRCGGGLVLEIYFFLPRSSFLTHFLDLPPRTPETAQKREPCQTPELTRVGDQGPEEPTGFGSAAVVAGVGGNATPHPILHTPKRPSFREDVKVVSVSGAIDDGNAAGGEDQFAASRKERKDPKRTRRKVCACLGPSYIGLYGSVPAFVGDFEEDDLEIPAAFQASPIRPVSESNTHSYLGSSCT